MYFKKQTQAKPDIDSSIVRAPTTPILVVYSE